LALFCLALLTISCSPEKKPNPVEDGDSATQRPAYIGNSPVILNEITPVNLHLKDHEGDDPAWVEIYNPADTAFNLAGYILTEDISNPKAWTFGNLVVPAHGYQLVFLSGKDIRTTTPASDSISLISTSGYTWADGDRLASEGVPGNSKAEPFEYGAIFDIDENYKPVVSASLTLGDNSTLPDSLQWSTSIVYMNIPAVLGKEADISACNVIVIKGYVQKGRSLLVRLVQPEVDDWVGWGSTIMGNGDPQGEYRVVLPHGLEIPDLQHIWAVKFEIPSPYLTTIQFTIRDVYALRDSVFAHTNFKMGKKASTLWLLDSLGIRDSISYPDMLPGIAWGYDSLGVMGYLSPPTPIGRSTGKAILAQSVAPSMVQAAGFYPAPVSVEVAVPAGTRVFYTLDGSVPTTSSPEYKTPIAIAKTTVVRTITFQGGALASTVTTRTFFIGDSASLPVVSISTDPNGLFDPDTGIYVEGLNPGSKRPYFGANWWAPKELGASVEFFEKGGALGFSLDAGLSIFGNWSRANTKKSMYLKFKERYGKSKLEYPLFPRHPELKTFQAFGLRSGGGNAGTDHIRDALAQSLTEGIDVDRQNHRPVVVYYNGEYYGVHRLVEKVDPDYVETNLGLDPEKVDFIEFFGAPKAGSNLSYLDLLDYMDTADMATAASAEKVRSLIDMNEYLNYLATQIYCNNTDWPANNWRAWRSNSPITKWRWVLFDVDFGFGSPNGGDGILQYAEFDMFPFVTNTVGDKWPNGVSSTRFIRGIFANPILRDDFINRTTVLLSYQFSPSRVGGTIDSMIAEIGGQSLRDNVRWGFDPLTWGDNLSVIKDFGVRRADLVRNHMRTFWGLGADLLAVISSSGGGVVQVNGLTLPQSSFRGTWFSGKPLQLQALAQPGKVFTGWSDGVKTKAREWIPTQGATLTAQFR
jgi:hypothetical protein